MKAIKVRKRKGAPKKKRVYAEYRLQVKIASIYNTYFPYVLWFAVPNGGKRSIQDAQRFKAMGVRAGVFDIFVAETTPIYSGLFIEVKKPGGGRVSAIQLEFGADAMARGYHCVVVDNLYDAVTELESYLGVPEGERISLLIGDSLRRPLGDTTV